MLRGLTKLLSSATTSVRSISSSIASRHKDDFSISRKPNEDVLCRANSEDPVTGIEQLKKLQGYIKLEGSEGGEMVSDESKIKLLFSKGGETAEQTIQKIVDKIPKEDKRYKPNKPA